MYCEDDYDYDYWERLGWTGGRSCAVRLDDPEWPGNSSMLTLYHRKAIELETVLGPHLLAHGLLT